MEKAQRRIKRRLTALVAVASLVALLLVAAPAGAATSAEQGYSTSARIEQTTDPGKLPFTGLDVVAIVAVGAALLAVGVGVRKLSSSAT
jgi:UPF0716 family protein affecting phage T7 exclusion